MTGVLDEIRALVASGKNARETIAAAVSSLSPDEVVALVYDWASWARPLSRNDDGTFGGQAAPPGDWDVWLVLAGRGYGKTRTAAEYMRARAREPGLRMAFVAQDPHDARSIMIDGESGIMAISPSHERPTYNPSLKLLRWPNGTIADVHSGHAPDALRGPQYHCAWVDELCAFRYPKTVFDNLTFGLRLMSPSGEQPRVVVTTTPKPIKLLRDIMHDAATVVTTGSSYDNTANLAPAYIKRVIRRYEGTTLGLQELHARILDEDENALWSNAIIDAARVREVPPLRFVCVAVDPMARASAKHNEKRLAPPETGIIVFGVDESGEHGYVLEDATETNAKPDVWARAAISAYHRWNANVIIGEVNNGGDMVEDVIHTRDKRVAFRAVHASHGKRARAEPVAALYQQGRVHHVGAFAALEAQMTTFTGASGEASPDRYDALVWAATAAMLGVPTATNVNLDLDFGFNETGGAFAALRSDQW